MYVKHIFKTQLTLAIMLVVILAAIQQLTPLPLNRKPKIVGGNITDISRFKFVACIVLLRSYDNITRRDRPFCGASIIRKHWVLTAAHCISYNGLFDRDIAIRKKALVVRGNTSFCSSGENRIDHVIIAYKTHELFKRKTGDYDIALLKVRQPFTGFNELCIKPAPSSYEYKVNSIAWVMGWGTTICGTTVTTNQLHSVDVKIFGKKECKEMWNSVVSSDLKITPRMLCAGWIRSGKDACGEDSGGPLIDKDEVLIGVVSWGDRLCGGGYPGVYSRVPIFATWINKHIEEDRELEQFSP